MQNSSTARGASSPFHIALHSSKKFAVYHTKRGNTLAGVYASFHQLSKSTISANKYRLKCLPVKRSATLVWSQVASNKKPGVKRRANPSLLRAFWCRSPRTEVLEARFAPTRSTLPISPLDERRTRSVSAHTAFTSVCRHSSIVSESRSSSSIFRKFFQYSSVENPAGVDNAGTLSKTAFSRVSGDPKNSVARSELFGSVSERV